MDSLHTIQTYTLDIYSGGSNAKGYEYRAIIGLYDPNDHLIGGIYFHRDATTLPEQDLREASGYVWCHVLWSEYPAIIDMLRNEAPVFLRYVDSWAMASLTTSLEPVGEQE
ncbi:MAG: hypothetical protein H6568_11635 [Lewinellaceae bacterium]|nr:hypothetical protein [Saprospiraceae bacterium]MCB9313404.1 hypothetical protein [Lewinellaceae bacterium]HRW76317.1 hypothetical protein [Saprospiraceae bacterium]